MSITHAAVPAIFRSDIDVPPTGDLLSTLKDAETSQRKFSVKATPKTIASLATAALLVALGVAFSIWSFRQIEDAAEARKHTYELISRDTGKFFKAV